MDKSYPVPDTGMEPVPEGSPEWRCWNGLSAEEFNALTEYRGPLIGCKCRGCLFLVVRGWKPISRADLLKPREAA